MLGRDQTKNSRPTLTGPWFRPEGRGAGARWAFTHNLLQDALCAEHWFTIVKTDAAAAIKHLVVLTSRAPDGLAHQHEAGTTPRTVQSPLDIWTEPTGLLANWMQDAGMQDDALALPLLRSESLRKLGLRVVRALDRVAASTWEEALNLLPSWAVDFQRARHGEKGLRCLAYDLLPHRVRGHEAEAVTVLRARAGLSSLPVSELGAVVETLAALDKQCRGCGAALAIREVLDGLPTLARSDVDQCFRWVPGHEREQSMWSIVHRKAKPFLIGSPAHEIGRWPREAQVSVNFESPYWMAATPVTLRQYELMAGPQCAHRDRWGDEPTVPVTYVSWFEARLFARWLQRQRERWPDAFAALALGDPHMHEFALPTEAQWERACRGESVDRFWNGDGEWQLDRVGWFRSNSDDALQPVGKKDANPGGLYDVHGNVWEWCADWFAERLGGGLDPHGPAFGRYRALRGGCWMSPAAWCRAAFRFYFEPAGTWDASGFRLCVTTVK